MNSETFCMNAKRSREVIEECPPMFSLMKMATAYSIMEMVDRKQRRKSIARGILPALKQSFLAGVRMVYAGPVPSIEETQGLPMISTWLWVDGAHAPCWIDTWVRNEKRICGTLRQNLTRSTPTVAEP